MLSSSAKKIGNWLRFHKVTDSQKMGTYLIHSVVVDFQVIAAVLFSGPCNQHNSGCGLLGRHISG